MPKQMIEIPAPLIQDILMEECVLFVGSGLSAEAGLPSSNDLCEILAEEADYPQNKPKVLPEVAQYYVLRFDKGRLFRVIRQEIGTGYSPGRSHKLIAQIPDITTVFTTNWDRLLEEALGVDPIVDDEAYAMFKESREVIKLHGCISRPDKDLIITKDDYNCFYGGERNEFLWNRLRDLLARKTFLFIGYSLKDPHLCYQLDQLHGKLGGLGRQGFAVLLGDDSVELQQLRERKIYPIVASARDFLTQLVARLDQERYRFANRERELELISAALAVGSHRLFEFVGIPGIGKTTLLRKVFEDCQAKGLCIWASCEEEAWFQEEGWHRRLLERIAAHLNVGEDISGTDPTRLLEFVKSYIEQEECPIIYLFIDNTEKLPLELPLDEGFKVFQRSLLEFLDTGKFFGFLAGKTRLHWDVSLKGRVKTEWLKPFSQDGTRDQLKGLGISQAHLTAKSLTELQLITCGHPLANCRIAQELQEAPDEKRWIAQNRGRLAEIADDAIQTYVLYDLSPEEREYVKTLSVFRMIDPEIIMDVLATFYPDSADISFGEVQVFLRRLMNMGVADYDSRYRSLAIHAPIRRVLLHSLVIDELVKAQKLREHAVKVSQNRIKRAEDNRSAWIIEWLYQAIAVYREGYIKLDDLSASLIGYVEKYYGHNMNALYLFEQQLTDAAENDLQVEPLIARELGNLTKVVRELGLNSSEGSV